MGLRPRARASRARGAPLLYMAESASRQDEANLKNTVDIDTCINVNLDHPQVAYMASGGL